jgi:glycosyltransferase involved in cell wall biosynthesis
VFSKLKATHSLWMLNHYAVTPDVPGGTRHFDLACELTRMGYDVAIFASAFNHPRREKVRLLNGESWELEEVKGVKFIWVPSLAYQGNNWWRLLNMLDYTWRAYWLGRRLPRLEPRVAPPDIVMGCSVHPFAVLAGYHLSRYYQTHFLMEVRDLWPQTFLDMGLWHEGQPQVRFFRWLEQFLYARAERIVTLSPLAREYLARYSDAWADKVVYIPNGTQVSRFEQVEAVQRQRSQSLPVMYLGAMGVTNGLDLVLRALRVVNQTGPGLIECTFVGDGPERSRLEHMAQDWGLDNVRFVGSVPRAQVPYYTAQADILVLVQKEVLYGSSNKLHDYMAAAKPIVFAVFAKHNNPVEQVRCGVSASPESAEDLAKKLLAVARMSEEERRVMGKRGRAYVRQYHDYSVLARRLVNTLKELDDGMVREAEHQALG